MEEWDFFFPFGDPESWGSFMCVQASRVALVVKNLPANVGDIRNAGSIPGLGRSSGGSPLQYSCLENLPWTEEPGRLQSIGSGHKELDATEVTQHTCVCATDT